MYAQAERFLGNYDGGIQALYQAEEIVPYGNNKWKSKIYNQMSASYCSLGDYTKAIELSDEAIALSKVENDSVIMAQAYNNRGIIHMYINESEQAERFFHLALDINRRHRNLKSIAANLNNLCLYPGDIPRAHGTAEDDRRHGKYSDENTPSESLDQAGLLNAADIVLQPHKHVPRRDLKRRFADICFLFKRINEHQYDRIHIQKAHDRKKNCQRPAVFCFSCSHYCCTSLDVVSLFWISAITPTMIKNMTAFACPTPSHPALP